MQPLLVMIVGVLATVATVRILRPSNASGENIVGVLVDALGLIVGLLITGFVVGRWSPDVRLALLASLLGAVALSVASSITQLQFAPSPVQLLTMIGAFIISMLVPIWIGLGVGRLVRPRPNGQPDATRPE